MIKFRTEVDIPDFIKKMGYRHQSLMIGSCFTENIGNYLQDRCLPVIVNPFGILYNPASIANSIELLISGKMFTDQDLFFYNGRYYSFSHHSRFSGTDPAAMLEEINTQIAQAQAIFKKGSHLLITFGTSWVFQHQETGKIVSNCHKLPAATFKRYCLSTGLIAETWIPLIRQIRKINPDLHLVFTVSPIRHLNDGAHGNQLSKSTLLLSIEALISEFGNELISYFPSYELQLDELRDYRFYATDMTHPSEVAIDFIRGKFVSALLDNEAKTIMAEVEKFLPALYHRPSDPGETGYLSFIDDQVEKIGQLQNKYPYVDMANLRKKFHEKRAR